MFAQDTHAYIWVHSMCGCPSLLTPDTCAVPAVLQDPGAAAWTAASAWAVQPGRYAAAATTRQQYFETGGSAARRVRGD